MKNLFISITLILSICHDPYISADNPKVAIIGGTFSGAACALYLRQLFHRNINIDAYDLNQYREEETTLTFNSNYQKHVEEIIKKFNLKSTNLYPESKPVLYDLAGNNKRLNIPKFKIDNPITQKLDNFLSSTYKKFQTIYQMQSDKKKFDTLKNLLDALDDNFFQYLSKPAEQFIEKDMDVSKKFSKFYKFLRTLNVQTYLKGLRSVHGFAALTGFWFSELNTGTIKRFEKTAHEIVREILQKEVNKIFVTKIQTIKRENGQNIIITKNGKKTNYDFVIMADPKFDYIEFSGYNPTVNNSYNYKDVLVVFLEGTLKKSCQAQDGQNLTSLINTYQEQIIVSAGKFEEWAIFSSYTPKMQEVKMSESTICFDDFLINDSQVIQGYPDYSKIDSAQKATFILGENLYNINAIDWAGYNSELMAIGAKNVALMVYDKIITRGKGKKMVE